LGFLFSVLMTTEQNTTITVLRFQHLPDNHQTGNVH
jgi:hypothetical protein